MCTVYSQKICVVFLVVFSFILVIVENLENFKSIAYYKKEGNF